MDLRDIRIGLNLIPAVGSTLSERVIKFFSSPEAIVSATKSELVEIKGIGPVTAAAISRLDWSCEITKEKREARKKGVHICVLEDEDYPEKLREIFDPPQVLYLKGKEEFFKIPMIAVVGSRTPSSYGKIAAEKLSADLSSNGLAVVSGFARGVDSVSHCAALKNHGATVAVLGSGMNCIYPPENRQLFQKISDEGLLVTEFPMNRRPDRMNFPRRNRIISGLSEGVLVVEAAKKSGSLITAEFALDQGKEVFAVPGNINSPRSKGTNALIKKGAVVTETFQDIVDELPQAVKERFEEPLKTNRSSGGVPASEDEKKLFSLFTEEEIHIDLLIKKAQLPPGMVSAILLKLEMKGLVRQLPGNFFIANI
ncbi:MAG: DNA-processing protein DprA [Nitrospinota bacterium]